MTIFVEFGLSLDESKQLENLTDGALIALGRYTLQNINWCRYGKLLLGLRGLSIHQLGSTLQNIFQNIIGDILMDRL